MPIILCKEACAIIAIQKLTFRSVFFQSFQMTKYNNDKQTWFSDTLTSARPLDGRFMLGFQHLHPRGPVGVNA